MMSWDQDWVTVDEVQVDESDGVAWLRRRTGDRGYTQPDKIKKGSKWR